MTDASTKQKLNDAIDGMVPSSGYDVVIVCTGNKTLEDYWQARLEATRGEVARSDAVILSVEEDWEGGAGNGLGTLYAYVKARAKAQGRGIDLDALLSGGAAVAMYHTAGKGTRLAPLPGSEANNKPGVRLPSLLKVDGQEAPLTILESVIRQTGLYAPLRKSRVSVFWGDQIFVPSLGAQPSGSHHADILASLGPMPSAAEWAERGLEKYGLIAVEGSGNAMQVEKVSHEVAVSLFESGGFTSVQQVGPSLGSFSVSAALLFGFLKEFATELESKKGQMDSDPHFWMPFTLPEAQYVGVMQTKGVSEADARSHHSRMGAFRDSFLAKEGGSILGCVDVGNGCYWWDYGQLKYYWTNNILILRGDEEAQALRKFMGVPSDASSVSANLGETKVSADALVLGGKLGSGSVSKSLLVGCDIGSVEATNCIFVNVVAKKVTGNGAILYNVVDDSEEGVTAGDGDVRADVFVPGEPALTIKSSLETDGGKAWKEKVFGNAKSFEQVHADNKSVDCTKAYAAAKAAGDSVRAAL